MASRMPSVRRPAQTSVASEDSVDNDGARKLRSQLPQLTPRSVKTTRDVSSSSLPLSSPIRPAAGIATRAKDDRAAMPPPSAPLTRTQSIRTRSIPQPPSSTTSTKSGIVAPSRSLSTRAPVSSSTVVGPKPRVLSHSRAPSASAVPTSSTGEASLKRSATVSTTRHLRSQSSTTSTNTGLKSRLTAPTAPTSTKASVDTVQPPVRRIARPGIASALPSLEPSQARPAFNTLQQHYSPAKTTLPKPPVPSSRAAPSAEEKAVQYGAVFETTKSQSELLYLTLLHESAESNLRSYEQSARRALQAEFKVIQDESREIREEERLLQEQGNLAAINDWLGLSRGKNTHMSQEAAETIQSLSGCLNELMMLSAPESKYAALVHMFSEWATEATEQDRAHIFSGPLPSTWHQLHASISQRVRMVEREVEMLPPVPSQSSEESAEASLAVMLRNLRSLVLGMKEELSVMVRLEQQVVSTEKERVSNAVAGLSLDAILQSSDEWTPAWQSDIL